MKNMTNQSGKALTVFIVVVMVLLVSSTSIGFFLYNKELQLRQSAEGERDTSRESEAKLQAELKEVKKQIVLLQDRNKEADEKINNLLDEMELNKGLRDELKKENAALKEQLDGFNKVKEKIKSDLDDSNAKLKEYQGLLRSEQDRASKLQGRITELETLKSTMEAKISEMKADLKPYNQRSPQDQIASEIVPPSGLSRDKVELDKIVVSPQEGVRGHILSIDKDTEFVICNLGFKQGVKSGDTLGIYRGEEYLGDVKVTRVQEEMSAADLIPPFSSRKVRKNDTVVLKQ